MTTDKRIEEIAFRRVTDAEIVDEYLRKVTVFTITSKEQLKHDVCKLIDERFAFIEADLRYANKAARAIITDTFKSTPSDPTV